jgi:hypothetical protein
LAPSLLVDKVKLGHEQASTSDHRQTCPLPGDLRLRLALACIAALSWQTGGFSIPADAPAAQPQHLRYVRSLSLPAGASGTVCAVLDASIYAHAASSSLDDLRIFRDLHGKKPEEVPFVVSYSEAEPTEANTATVRNLVLRHDDLSFDLIMPPRPYTLVDLHLAAQSFVAVAKVSGSDGNSSFAKPLGTYSLFDLTQQHLPRSTVIALQESTFRLLHIVLRLHRIDGQPYTHLSTVIIQGATIPASREAQTLYTVVAASNRIFQQANSSAIQVNAPAHVPIERVDFILNPSYKTDFLRHVSITANSDEQVPSQPKEVIDGEIWRVTRSADASGDSPIHAAKLTLTSVLASNLRASATVSVDVDNGSAQPLLIKAVQLEMRQRTACFQTTPGFTYALRYGDGTLHASVYDLRSLAELPVEPAIATLGPEQINPYYVHSSANATSDERNPHILWVALLAGLATAGAVASRHARLRERHR